MERWNGRVALVTGASVGIGAAICRELVKYGLKVVGCARNLKKIEELAEENEVRSSPGRIFPVKCDVSVESEILDLFQKIREKFGRIDMCINNAGLSTDSPLLTGETSDWRNMLESISPGTVQTEFFPRFLKDKPEVAEAVYNSMECLQSRDIADAVTYILMTPPHVDINDIIIRPVEQAN